MNTKRQTIWLVSMLSIMVVLSAYYLFTYDEEELLGMNADDVINDHQIDLESYEVDLNDYDINDDVLYLDDEFADADYGDLAEILGQLETQQLSSRQSFDVLHLQREEDIKAELNRWLAVAASGNVDEQINAQEQIYELSDNWTRVSHLEDVIRRDFPDAHISQADNKWLVMVHTNHMEKSQAVSIMNLVMEEMGATIDQVVVELSP